MTVLQDLHGAVGALLLCALLFAEEVGVPLPFAPGEICLITGGLLVATGALDPWVFVPLAIASVVLGALTGYWWARAAGERALLDLADRLNARAALARASARLRDAGPQAVAVSRAVPGLRVYTNLVAGAARVRRGDFLLGIVPVSVAWVCFWTALGALVGTPAARYFSAVQGLALRGGILVLAGIAAYLLVRKVPQKTAAALAPLPPRVRVPLAVALDAGVAGTVTAGALAIGRHVLGFDVDPIADPWVDALAVAIFMGLFITIVAVFRSRRSAAGTVTGPGYRSARREQHGGPC